MNYAEPMSSERTYTRFPVNVGDSERALTGAAAAALAIYGLRRRGAAGFALAAAGGFLGWRAASGHCPAYQLAGVNTAHHGSTKAALAGSRGVHVLERVVVRRPAAEVYRFWRNFSNLPRFLRHLESVTGDGPRSHWVTRGPVGTRVEWDAEIVNEVENKVIGWRSLEGADVAHAGSVNFEEVPGGGTEVRVKLQYEPPAGKAGALVAGWLGADPATQIREDLGRLKEILEGRSSVEG
jgi:uncharacterized membrane protein